MDRRRMSYTYIPAGLTGAAFDDLAAPVAGRLFFAGEATHRRHYGTAHGAYDSGRQAAVAVAAQLGQQQRLWQGHMREQQLQQRGPKQAQWQQEEQQRLGRCERQQQQQEGREQPLAKQGWWPGWARPVAAAAVATADGVRRRRRSAQPTSAGQGRPLAAAVVAAASHGGPSGPMAVGLYGGGGSAAARLYGGGSSAPAGLVGEAALVLAPTGDVQAGGGEEGVLGGAGEGWAGLGNGAGPGMSGAVAEAVGGAGMREASGVHRSRL
ncbi:Lysine-specific histone demethylase 1 2 [Tetrabaena socialis]|uniref:Lysine-specific histone demethylase 1 2 n=1 Tax=Tetrabaena socialis TaxID=47790 RepID=A0A2J8AKB5_9CHLO|nr:Lysine-specific histone demethylase 1 2 [Tetrabaena socialis]|eukprot:PNH12966.1 Lysine-specific histone demethylase 1 2 [Tetrabaena socialis]